MLFLLFLIRKARSRRNAKPQLVELNLLLYAEGFLKYIDGTINEILYNMSGESVNQIY